MVFYVTHNYMCLCVFIYFMSCILYCDVSGRLVLSLLNELNCIDLSGTPGRQVGRSLPLRLCAPRRSRRPECVITWPGSKRINPRLRGQ